MFFIIGGDGREYGPVATEQVRAWITAGRANLDTKAKAAGTEEWRRLGDFAEFGGGAGLPPVIPAAGMALAPGAPVDVPGTTIASGPFAGVSFTAVSAAAAAQPLAGLGERFGAAVVDGFVEMLCWLPTTLTMMKAVQEQIASGSPNIAEMTVAMSGSMTKSFPFLGALVVVQCVLLSVRSQSIGKLIFGLRIVRYKTGETGGFLYAFLLRGFLPWALCQIPLLGKLFWLVDVCFIFGEERRCVHDFIGGTKVVKPKV